MDIFENISQIKDIETLKTLKKKINEAFDDREKMIDLCMRANKLSEESFGYIKECFESLSPSLFGMKDGKSIMKRYKDMIKGNTNLSSMHTLCETIRKANKNTDINFLVGNIASTDWKIDKKTLKEDTLKVGKLLAEAYLVLGEDCEKLLPEKNETLYNAINFIAENTKTNKNMVEYGNAVQILRENIEKNEVISNSYNVSNLTESLSDLVEKFNKKYFNELNEQETTAIKMMLSHGNHEQIFNQYKSDCTAKLSEAKEKFLKEGDNTSAEKINAIMEQIEKKIYSEETINNDICNLIDITTLFE